MRRIMAFILCIFMVSIPGKAASSEKLVALTFDDGPSGRFTRRLLEGLQSRGVQATFLLCGYRIEQYPQLTQQIADAGHEIGLHGYSHKSMQNMCPKEVAKEISDLMALLPSRCQVSFLRPPGGLCGKCVQTVAEDYGLSILSWSIDPKDWAIDDAQAIVKAVLDKTRDGDVILLHDMSDSSVTAALAIVDALQARGFRFVTASQLAQARNVALIPGKKYTHFPKNDSKDPK